MFFQSYFSQASVIANLLSIKLTSKTFGKVAQPFSGFPLSHLSKHVSTLVSQGNRVVIIEEDPHGERDESNIIKRTVSRIVSPGTGLDDGFVKSDRMNFILSVQAVNTESATPGPIELELAYKDVSTGASFTRLSSRESVVDDLILINPREIVLASAPPSSSDTAAPVLADPWEAVVKVEGARRGWMVRHMPSPNTGANSGAESLLLAYLAENFPASPSLGFLPSLRLDPVRDNLTIDSNTLASLEIKSSLRGGVKGSLLSVVKRTVTAGGGRLLGERICQFFSSRSQALRFVRDSAG